jgi:hypothetical protein
VQLSSGRPIFLNRLLPSRDHDPDEVFAMCKSRGSAASVQHDQNEKWCWQWHHDLATIVAAVLVPGRSILAVYAKMNSLSAVSAIERLDVRKNLPKMALRKKLLGRVNSERSHY